MAHAAEKALKGVEKAAILLVLLGEEATAAVYRNLSEEDLQRLSQQIASLQNVPPEAASHVLQEYNQLTTTQDYLAEGGAEVAARLLTKAFGETAAKSLIEQVMEA